MRITGPIVVGLVLGLAVAACARPYWDPKAYWTRPAASLPQVARESDACYRAALDPDMPAAFPRDDAGGAVLARTTPPPRLWTLAPRDVSFERFDEQLRYERCMRLRGWEPRRVTTPTL